uniref:Uncharacterized protein n=1 Tax=Siphoviridae sp. ctNHg2 TaxID=2825467 RepID=A0A8S5V4K1_9CAUD|nr:MAG TPA: hypothetical protein [Siphoviridae sp. ctNHg2]
MSVIFQIVKFDTQQKNLLFVSLTLLNQTESIILQFSGFSSLIYQSCLPDSILSKQKYIHLNAFACFDSSFSIFSP